MSNLSRESRELLAESRDLDHLSVKDKARIRGQLMQRIGTSVAFGAALTAGAATADAARPSMLATVAAWLPASPKVLGVIALVGSAAVGAGVVSSTATTATIASATAAIAGATAPTIAGATAPTIAGATATTARQRRQPRQRRLQVRRQR